MFLDLLLACYLANAACAIMNIMTALIFIIVSRLHAFFLVVPVGSSLHVLVVVAVISYFQPAFFLVVPAHSSLHTLIVVAVISYFQHKDAQQVEECNFVELTN